MGKIADMIFDDLVARGKGLHTANQWRVWMVRFELACGVKERYEREDVIRFLGEERKRGYCQNTINTHEKPVKLLASIQGWDYPKLSMRKVKDSEVNRPIFEREEVEVMIRVGRKVLSGRELAYLALATTYGLRREEMCSGSEPEISEGKIIIHPVKGGDEVTQLIPFEINGYLKGYSPCSVSEATQMFRRILKKSGLKVGKGYGWHSIRRALATELMMEEISGLNVVRFMRWSEGAIKGEMKMLRLYAKKDQGRVDREVFRVHPFLPCWSDDKREEKPVEEVNGLAKFISDAGLSEEEVKLLVKLVKVKQGS